MPNKNQKTLSINGELYARPQAKCREQGRSIAGLIEELVRDVTANAPRDGRKAEG